MLICDKCSARLTEGTKYCHQCGDPVTELDRVSNGVVSLVQTGTAQITFGYSASANYEKAVSICRNIPSHTTEGEGKQAKHSVTLSLTEVELITHVFDLVGGWKSSRMLLNGKPATKKNLTYGALNCFSTRQQARNREQYCYGETLYQANIWGCFKLRMPVSEWGGGWLEYGSFDDNGTWYFDKHRIQQHLEKELDSCDLCPALDRHQVLQTLQRFPQQVNPKKDSNWEYVTRHERVKLGEYRELAIGVRPILRRINAYVISSYKPYWSSDTEPRSAIPEPTTSKSSSSTEPNRLLQKTYPPIRRVGLFLLAVLLPALPLLLMDKVRWGMANLAINIAGAIYYPQMHLVCIIWAWMLIARS